MLIDEMLFWSKVDRRGPEECWPWLTKSKLVAGYGIYATRRFRDLGHRVAYRLTHGDIPKGMFICHRCDNPGCCNPAHLFMGPPRANAADMRAKGRASIMPKGHTAHVKPERLKRGENHGCSRLTAENVREIYRLRLRGDTFKAIGRAFGIAGNHARLICRGRKWAHLLGKEGAPSLEELTRDLTLRPRHQAALLKE